MIWNRMDVRGAQEAHAVRLAGVRVEGVGVN